MHADLVELIRTIGYVGLFAIVFAESGLFFGFFLPGDSLLLTAGLLASRVDPETGHALFSLWILLPGLFLAAVLGDNVGYWFGNKTGRRIFNRENSLFFRQRNLLRAKEFYERHGGKTIVLARFLPMIRTFAPIVAGAVEMDYRRFFFFNVLGGLLWAVGLTMAGYYLGNIPGVDNYFIALVAVVIVVSGLPGAWHIWRENRHELWAALRATLRRRVPEETSDTRLP